MTHLESGYHDRPTSDKRIEAPWPESDMVRVIQPTEFRPIKFFGVDSKRLMAREMLNWEEKQKYLNRYSARMKAKIELGSLGVCFNDCIQNIDDVSLAANEKNCMRECYFKRISAKDDMMTYFVQKYALAKTKNVKEDFV